MDNDEIILEFLKGLRIALNNASAYNKDHPYFRKSVETFKEKVDLAFPVLNPIKINIAPDSIFVDDKKREKQSLYTDLADAFHLRKIKSFQINSGVTVDELVEFLSCVSLPKKELFRRGGVGNILNKESIPHLAVEELDYSQLLREDGEEAKDIWVYFFKAAIEKEDPIKINELADNFQKVMSKFKVKDLSEDEDLRENITNFLAYLKGKDAARYVSCTKGLFKLFLKDKAVSCDEKLFKIKEYFNDLSKDELTQLLWDEITQNEDFNYLSFSAFTELLDEQVHKGIIPDLENKIRNSEAVRSNLGIRKKIKELFSVSESSFITGMYRHALHWLFSEETAQVRFSFNRELIEENYRLVLLNLLIEEKDGDKLDLISERVSNEIQKIKEITRSDYVKNLLETLEKKSKDEPALFERLLGLQKEVCLFIENKAFEIEEPGFLAAFLPSLKKSFAGENFYLNRVFDEAKFNSNVLELFFKFFPDKLLQFYQGIEGKRQDLEFLTKMVKAFENVHSPLGVEALKKIFYSSNSIVKIEVLRSMQAMQKYDKEFLFSVVQNEENFLKKEALLALKKDDNGLSQALEALINVESPWGGNNKVILERMNLADEMGLKQAKDPLTAISSRRFFWNRNIRGRAREILRKWNA